MAQFGRVGDDVAVGCAECDIPHTERDGALAFVGWFGVFPHSEQVIKCNGDKSCHGCSSRVCPWC